MAQILGLDLGLTTGWGVLREGAVVGMGHWCSRGPNEGRKAEVRYMRDALRFYAFREALISTLCEHPCDMVAYELVEQQTSKAQGRLYSGWRAMVLCVCAELGVRPWPVPQATLKSVASGGGTPDVVKSAPNNREARRAAWKAYVIAAAERKWGITAPTDDEADAIWAAEACRLDRGG